MNMNDFSFEHQGIRTYLVYELGEDDVLDSMSLGMVTHNRISGLAETSYTQMDENKFLKYDVTSRVTVKQFFNGPVNRKRLLTVFSCIVNAMISAEEYMIDYGSLLLDTDYIFVDISSCDTVMICLPLESKIKGEDTPVDAGAFFKNLVFSTQYDQTENCDHVAQIINYLNSAATFSLASFHKLLSSLNGEPVQSARPAASAAQPQSTSASQHVVQQPVIQQAPVQQPVIQQPAVQQPVIQQPVVQQPVVQQPVVQRTAVQPQAAQTVQREDTTAEKMSALYLLRHYNKENAEIYKAQKAAGSSAKTGNAAKDKKESKKKEKKSKQTNESMGFSVPGMSNSGNTGIAEPVKQVENAFSVPKQAAVSAQSYATPAATRTEQPVAVVSAAVQSAPVQPTYYQSAGKSMNFGETTVLSPTSAGETTVLSSANSPEAQVHPHLIRKKNNEKIMLNKPVFRIGKEKSYVDYFVGDNPTISRSHANIISRDDEYYIMDTNSKNHTYVNGMVIPPNEEVKLEHGTLIVLANESFEFRLY